MLGVVICDRPGQGDALLSAVAATLSARGLRVIGALQEGVHVHMDLHLLATGQRHRISLPPTPGARACRLDPQALADAVAMVQAQLAAPADLLILNKFARLESRGNGFVPVIADALEQGLPVLTTVAPAYRAALGEFAAGHLQPLAATETAILTWVRGVGATFQPQDETSLPQTTLTTRPPQ